MKVNVYLPDELGRRVKEANLNVSAICQAALTTELIRAASDGNCQLSRRQLQGQACVYCGSENQRSLVLEFYGGNVRLVRCATACSLEPVLTGAT